MDSDLELARRLQAEFEREEANAEMAPFLPPAYRTPQKPERVSKLSPVDSEWETIDPTPDLHALFIEFNKTFFWGKLLMCEVKWSPRMTTCAGICRYSPRERFCTIGISIPLLKLRPRKDLVETLLHEMIHALLFITDNNTDRDGHGPEFHKHMYRINAATGANISVYHTFHDEVALYKQHWWRCGGPCTKRPPFYGFVKRAMNRAPGPSDRWWGQHQQNCGGIFVKVKEPEDFGKKGKKQVGGKGSKENNPSGKHKDIRGFMGGTSGGGMTKNGVGMGSGAGIKSGFGNGTQAAGAGEITGKGGQTAGGKPKGLWDANEVRKKPIGGLSSGGSALSVGGGVNKKPMGGFSSGDNGPSVSGGGTSRSGGGPGASGGGGRGNIFGFGGSSFQGTAGGGGLKTKGKSGTMVVRPGSRQPEDNSSGGSVVGGGLEMPSDRYQGASGFRLGSEGAKSGGSTPVRDRVRERWASVGSTARVESKSGAVSKKSGSELRTASSSGLPPLGKKPGADVRAGSSLGLTPPSPEQVPCPVCSKRFPPDQINTHLDTCLVKQDNKEDIFGQDNKEDIFGDEDDDDLLLATVELENSLHETEHNSSKIVISDSDDDEPLIKRSFVPKDSKKLPSEDDSITAFDNLTAQDDLDILAALEDTGSQEGDTSMFSCPVCQVMLDHKLMNQHLDSCLC